ncbi:hypothetical protein I4F81_012887 [Pyropia yezoensis]|uniref:Uncharacterized protein n=1 Tax=Pyropia yezoensis TaxID=2788 RepID=A0ACC3CJP0_PYRYE|nr:hypothetical protein I4F81_012887 [Neopyropia yezoensis]
MAFLPAPPPLPGGRPDRGRVGRAARAPAGGLPRPARLGRRPPAAAATTTATAAAAGAPDAAADGARRPVLLRGVLPFTPPLTPATLAGLAVEPGVAARVVTYAPTAADDGGDGGGTYTLAADPDAVAAGLDTFPDAGGSLLVAGCEALVPPLAGGLLGSWAGLVGGWRTGDVMVSYASAGGTVGPHVDSYDVFLVAGAGAREWRVAYEPLPTGAEVEVPHCPLRVLAGPGGGVFTEPRGTRWVSYAVRPGDVVYVPRRHPHWGVSVGPAGGMTYSVGLRAPAAADVARAYVADVADGLCGGGGVADPVAAMVAALTPPWAAATAAAAAAAPSAAAAGAVTAPVAAAAAAAATTAVDELGDAALDALWAATVATVASAGRAGFDDWARRELTTPKGDLEEVPPAEWDEMDAGAARDAAVAAAMDTLLARGGGGDGNGGGGLGTPWGGRHRRGDVAGGHGGCRGHGPLCCHRWPAAGRGARCGGRVGAGGGGRGRVGWGGGGGGGGGWVGGEGGVGG